MTLTAAAPTDTMSDIGGAPSLRVVIDVMDAPKETRIALARHPNIAPEVLIVLARDKDIEIRRAAASNPNIPPDVMMALMNTQDQETHLSIATNPSAPQQVLARLFMVYVQTPRYNAAHADIDVSRETHQQFQLALVRNPNTSLGILQELATSNESNIKAGVARHPQVSTDILVWLAHSPDIAVQYAAVENPKLPSAALQMLSHSTHNPDILRAISRHPQAGPDTLNWLTRQDDPVVRTNIIYNPNTPSDTISVLLSAMEDANAKASLLHRPGVSRNLVMTLLADPKVRAVIANDTRIPAPIREAANRAVFSRQ